MTGAIAVFLIAWPVQSMGFAIGERRVTSGLIGVRPVSFGGLFGYRLPFFPASLAGSFDRRGDAYLIALLITDPSRQLG